MPSILICAAGPLREDLRSTIVWREGHVHHLATTAEQALRQALALHPDLILIDRDLTGALRLVEDMRRSASTRGTSIAVAAKGDITDLELQFLQSGANAVIRLPAGPESDDRLCSLMRVPGRRASRVPVNLELRSTLGGGLGHPATAVNISETGMLIETDQGLRVGSELELRMELSGRGGLLECHARVVREDEPGRYGVHFEDLERDALVRIRGFVALGSTTDRLLAADRPRRTT